MKAWQAPTRGETSREPRAGEKHSVTMTKRDSAPRRQKRSFANFFIVVTEGWRREGGPKRTREREKVCYTFNILCTDIRETEIVGCVVSLETSYSKRIDRMAFEMRACLYRKRTPPSSIPSAILFERFYSRFNQRIDISVNDWLGCLLNEWLIKEIILLYYYITLYIITFNDWLCMNLVIIY